MLIIITIKENKENTSQEGRRIENQKRIQRIQNNPKNRQEN